MDQSLSRELLDLVNENYGDFLSLGSALRGGDEKVEEVRVGLLSFKRDVQAMRDKLEARRTEVEQLLKEKRRLRENANLGKLLLDFADRIEELELRLMIRDARNLQDTTDEFDTESDLSGSESDGSDDGGFPDGSATAPVVSLKKLEHHIQKYVYLTTLSARIGNDHPFLLSQKRRMAKIRSTLALDLKAALKQTKNAGKKRDAKELTVLSLYNLIGEDVNSVSGLKNPRI